MMVEKVCPVPMESEILERSADGTPVRVDQSAVQRFGAWRDEMKRQSENDPDLQRLRDLLKRFETENCLKPAGLSDLSVGETPEFLLQTLLEHLEAGLIYVQNPRYRDCLVKAIDAMQGMVEEPATV